MHARACRPTHTRVMQDNLRGTEDTALDPSAIARRTGFVHAWQVGGEVRLKWGSGAGGGSQRERGVGRGEDGGGCIRGVRESGREEACEGEGSEPARGARGDCR